MGEIADMMLSGVMCACCGEWLDVDGDGEEAGFPVLCNDCQQLEAKLTRHRSREPVKAPPVKPHQCDQCGKRFKDPQHLRQHRNAVHQR